MTVQQLKQMTKGMNPAQFEEFLTENGIVSEWLEVCVSDFNDGIYHVYLSEHDLSVGSFDGNEIEFLD